MKSMSNEIAVRGFDKLALEPRSLEEAKDLAKMATATKFWGVDSPHQAFMIIKQGQELGMTAVQSLNSIHIIKNKPVISAQGMVSVALASGKADYLKCIEQTEQKAVWKTHRKDDPDPEPTVIEFTIKEAQQMGLTSKDNWRKQPKTMLKWRAAASITREVYPDVVAGMYTPEEITEGEVTAVEIEEKRAPRTKAEKMVEDIVKEKEAAINAEFEEVSETNKEKENGCDLEKMSKRQLWDTYMGFKKELSPEEFLGACEGLDKPESKEDTIWCIEKLREYSEMLANK